MLTSSFGEHSLHSLLNPSTYHCLLKSFHRGEQETYNHWLCLFMFVVRFLIASMLFLTSLIRPNAFILSKLKLSPLFFSSLNLLYSICESSVWTLQWIWQEVYAKKSIQSLAYGGNSFQRLSGTAVYRDCTVSRPYWCGSIINISAVKGNLFVNTMPASFYHFIHPMQCTRTDLQLMLNTHQLTPIYISSGTVSDVIVSGILSKQVCNFCSGTVYKTKTQCTVTELEVTFCHYKVHFNTACRMHEGEDSLQDNDMSH